MGVGLFCPCNRLLPSKWKDRNSSIVCQVGRIVIKQDTSQLRMRIFYGYNRIPLSSVRIRRILNSNGVSYLYQLGIAVTSAAFPNLRL